MLSAKARILAVAALLAAPAIIPGSATAQPQGPGFIQGGNSVNVYTSRDPSLVLPIFYEFTYATGIAVNTIYVNPNVSERLAREGQASPADVIMLEDFGELVELAALGLTQPLQSAALNARIPENLRDPNGHWYATSIAARLIFASVDRVTVPTLTYEDLADPEWSGRVCASSGDDPSNATLFAAYVAKHGEAAAQQYLTALHANLARPADGDDRDGVRDIFAGTCDLALGDSFYYGLMRTGVDGEEAMTWANAVRPIMPTFDDGLGTHINVTAAAVAANAPHRDNAIRFLEFLVSDAGQQVLAGANFEYPVVAGGIVDPIINALGRLVIDPTPLLAIAGHRDTAGRLIETVGFNN